MEGQRKQRGRGAEGQRQGTPKKTQTSTKYYEREFDTNSEESGGGPHVSEPLSQTKKFLRTQIRARGHGWSNARGHGDVGAFTAA